MNYQRVYNRLVAFARERKQVVGPVEVHHIVPRSLGGGDSPSNLISLTPREHYVAHYLLWKIHHNRAAALAFTLMARGVGKVSSRAYAAAKTQYAQSMLGGNNVSKRPEVRAALSAGNARYWAGKRRPKHSACMQKISSFVTANPRLGQGDAQRGARNPAARSVWLKSEKMQLCFPTVTEAAAHLGVTVQALSQALRRGSKSQGWIVEGGV